MGLAEALQTSPVYPIENTAWPRMKKKKKEEKKIGFYHTVLVELKIEEGFW